MPVAGQHEAGEIRFLHVDARLADRLRQRQRHGGEFLWRGVDERALQGDASAVADHVDVDLRGTQVLPQTRGQAAAQFLDGHALDVHLARVRIEERAIGLYQPTVGDGLLLVARGGGQFRVIPDGDEDRVAGLDAVNLGLVAGKLGRQRDRLARRGDQFGRDRDHARVAALDGAAIGGTAVGHVLARATGQQRCQQQGSG